MQLLAISGSLRAESSNGALLRAAAQLAPSDVAVTIYEGLASLPPFDPDVEERVLPPAAADLRQLVAAADGLLIASPEYAHGVAGSLKNALDWLVGSTEFAGKPVAIFNASLSATHAHGQLVEILTTMAANVVADASLRIPVSRADTSVMVITGDPVRAELVERALDAMRRAIVAARG